jgi:hypothetical protein
MPRDSAHAPQFPLSVMTPITTLTPFPVMRPCVLCSQASGACGSRATRPGSMIGGCGEICSAFGVIACSA